MKKLFTIIATTLVISVSSTAVFAAAGGHGRNFVDNDNDGVCDYHNTYCQFVDADGDGICDNHSSNSCKNGAGFVDADGDGICDNHVSNSCKNGAGFVDADGDGICDNNTAGTPQSCSGFNQGHCGGKGRHCK